MGIPLIYSVLRTGGTRTDSSGTVQWTVPATSANTGGYINFALTGQNVYRVLPAYRQVVLGNAVFAKNRDGNHNYRQYLQVRI